MYGTFFFEKVKIEKNNLMEVLPVFQYRLSITIFILFLAFKILKKSSVLFR